MSVDRNLLDHGRRVAELEGADTGVGLKAAKDAVDGLTRTYRPGG